jgi:hypothetical protein
MYLNDKGDEILVPMKIENEDLEVDKARKMLHADPDVPDA